MLPLSFSILDVCQIILLASYSLYHRHTEFPHSNSSTCVWIMRNFLILSLAHGVSALKGLLCSLYARN